MKRITFLINSLAAGGAERVLSLIVKKLSEDKIKINIICLEKNNFYTIPKKVKIIYLSKNNNNKNIVIKIVKVFYTIFKLRSFIINRKIRVVQSHLFRANYVNLLTKLIGTGHKVQVVNTVAVGSKYSKKTLKGRLNLLLIKYLYPLADELIFKSQAMTDDFKLDFKFRIKYTVINNPYDFKMINSLSSANCNNNIKVNKNTIVSVGRFESHKHYELLIEVFKKLSINFPKLNLMVIGDGPEKQKIQNQVKELKIEERVQLPGRLKNPFYFFKNAAIYVSCSESEGFPNALVEAMICGLPVISTDCLSGPREILAPDTDPNQRLESGYECAQYGILFAVSDKHALEKAINLLLKDNTIYKRYQKRNKEVVKKYSIDNIIKQYKAVLGITKD